MVKNINSDVEKGKSILKTYRYFTYLDQIVEFFQVKKFCLGELINNHDIIKLIFDIVAELKYKIPIEEKEI